MSNLLFSFGQHVIITSMEFVHLSIVGHTPMIYHSGKRLTMLLVTFVNYPFNLFYYIICIQKDYIGILCKKQFFFFYSEPDKQGHTYGPDSKEVRDTVSKTNIISILYCFLYILIVISS